ncbi:hypothetical protein, partial [Paracoccus rhizosphaerae]
MELQASFPAPRKIEDEWRSDSFYISCGRRYEVAGIKHRLTENGGEKLGHGSGGMELLRAA